MKKSPCQDCPYRKATCHDRCEEYLDYHDELVAAREALRTADRAIGVLIAGARKRVKRQGVKK